MIHKAVQVRLYPTTQQQTLLAQAFGCCRWWCNYAFNKSIETYKETGKGLGRSAVNALLPALKKAEDTCWLADCYSQLLQATTLNLTTAYWSCRRGDQTKDGAKVSSAALPVEYRSSAFRRSQG